MNPYEVIYRYYKKESRLCDILLRHSESVMRKAVDIVLLNPELKADLEFVAEASLLHDIGIFMTDAEGIMCFGNRPYIEHGYLGAELMRLEGYPRHALVCERHTGTGLTKEQIESNGWNIPHRDMVPVSVEEQIICYADKFFSKTRLDEEYTADTARKKLEKFGEEGLRRFDRWTVMFG